MRRSERCLVVAGFLFCWMSGWAWAQEATPEKVAPALKKPEITAEQVLEQYIEATGGRPTYEKLTSSVSKGTMELTAQSIRGTLETFAKAPNRFLLIQEIEGIGRFMQGYDGQTAWSQDPFLGLREMEGAELANFKREATFNGDLKWRELYEKVELVGTEKVEDKEVYVIRLTPRLGHPVTRYYDTQTHLLLRMDTVNESPLGTLPMQMYPMDYREVDGVKVPFQVKIRASSGEVIMTTTEVKSNVEIDDGKFVKPVPVKKEEKTE